MPLSYWTFNIFQFKQHSSLHSPPLLLFFLLWRVFFFVVVVPSSSKSFVPLKKFSSHFLYTPRQISIQKVFLLSRFSILNEIVDVIDSSIQPHRFFVSLVITFRMNWWNVIDTFPILVFVVVAVAVLSLLCLGCDKRRENVCHSSR